MRLSRTDLVPMLAIIGGGTVCVLTFGSLVLRSASDDVTAPEPVVISQNGPSILPDGQWIAYQSDESGEPRIYMYMADEPLVSVRGRWRLVA